MAFSVAVLWSLGSGAASAGSYSSMELGPNPNAAASNAGAPAPESYGDTVKRKLSTGILNMAGGWVEIPKNMINTTNNTYTSNLGASSFPYGYIFWGITAGGLKGAMHTLGRTLAGFTDFATFFIPTQPIISPPSVWDNFYTDTQYGPYFKVGSQGQQAGRTTGKAAK